MRILLVLSALFSAVAFAGPTLTTEPVDPVSTHCGWSVDGSARSDSTVSVAAGQKVCAMNVAGIMGRTHAVDVTVSYIDPVWGKRESAPSEPYTIAPATAPTAPEGLKLVP